MARTPKPRPELVPFSAKLTPRAKVYLESLATLEGKTAYGLLEEAFWFYFENAMSEDKQAVVKNFADAALVQQQQKAKKSKV